MFTITCYSINYNDKRDRNLYKIESLPSLINEIINNFKTIHQITFYCKFNNIKIALLYTVIHKDDSYIFAPYYNMTSSVKNEHLNDILTNFMQTITEISADIKSAFIDKIDVTQEIIDTYEY